MTTISESTFLLTELRYTLGQLHVQVLDLDETVRGNVVCGTRSINQILQELMQAEGQWQARYAAILQQPAPQPDAADSTVPLPVSNADEQPGIESTFEHKRTQTIAMLEKFEGSWPAELLDAVKEQVAGDRQVTTAIAECRKSYFEQEQRPDLQQPLTTDPTPKPQA